MYGSRTTAEVKWAFASASSSFSPNVASKQSVIQPGTDTKIHFDVHMNVHFFTNQKQLKEKLDAAIKKNSDKLLSKGEGRGAYPFQRASAR